MVTTTSITAVSASTRRAQSTFSVPTVNQFVITDMVSGWLPRACWKKITHEKTAESIRNEVVTISQARSPRRLTTEAGDEEAEKRQPDDEGDHEPSPSSS